MTSGGLLRIGGLHLSAVAAVRTLSAEPSARNDVLGALPSSSCAQTGASAIPAPCRGFEVLMQDHSTDSPLSSSRPGPGIAVLAAIGVALVGLGEFKLHFTGSLAPASEDAIPFAFFLEISRDRLVLGHFLTVFSVAAYFLGYWHVSRRLAPASQTQRAFFFGTSLYAMTLAAIWIGSRAFFARSLQLVDDRATQVALGEEYELLLESMIWGLRIGMLLLGGSFAWLVARGRTSYPRWMAVANPAVLLIAVILTILVPTIGVYLVPIALNVAHVPFFLLSAFVPFVDRSAQS